MTKYICKCGREFKKSTESDTTGYRLEGYGLDHECYGCPYAMAVKDNHWNDNSKQWDYVIRAWECRASQKLRYSTYASLSLGSKNSGCIYSLDFDFLKKVQKAIEKIDAIHVESNPPGERGPQYGADGLYRLPIYADQNKKGITAKQTLFDMFFESDGSRNDVTPEEEKLIVLKQIEEETMGKINLSNINDGMTKVKAITESLANVSHFEMVPIELIELADYNPFSEKDTDESRYQRAMSIQASGLIEPLAVNKKSDEKYKLISGEHRFSSIQQYLNWKTVPCMVFEGISDDEAQLKLYEANTYREYTSEQKFERYQELDKLLRRMKESGKFSGGIQKAIAERLGVTERQVRKYKAIDESLPEDQKAAVTSGKLSVNDAYRIARPAQEPAQPEDRKSGTGSAFGSVDTPQPSTDRIVPQKTELIIETDTPNRKFKHYDHIYFIKADENNSAKFRAYFTSGNSEDIPLGSLPDSFDTFKQAQDALNSYANSKGYEEIESDEKQPLEKSGTSTAFDVESAVKVSNSPTPFNLSHIGSFNDAVSLLSSMPYYPGQECAIITNSNTTQQGIIDHFEVYESSLRISILVKNLRHSYHVASIGKDLFIGSSCVKQAREAAQLKK